MKSIFFKYLKEAVMTKFSIGARETLGLDSLLKCQKKNIWLKILAPAMKIEYIPGNGFIESLHKDLNTRKQSFCIRLA